MKKFKIGQILQITTLNGSVYLVKFNRMDKNEDIYGDYVLLSCLIGGVKHSNPNILIRPEGCFMKKGNKSIKLLPNKSLPGEKPKEEFTDKDLKNLGFRKPTKTEKRKVATILKKTVKQSSKKVIKKSQKQTSKNRIKKLKQKA